MSETACSEPVPGDARRLEAPHVRARRTAFFGMVALTTALGAWMMLRIVGAGGISLLELGILALFVPTFGWISIAFWNAVAGFALTALGRHPVTLRRLARPGSGSASVGGAADGPLRARTALAMPARNEDPDRVLSGIRGILSSLEDTGHAGAFDIHLLSDTDDPRLAEAEEAAWQCLVEEHSGPSGLHYRRRRRNEGRKAGNVAELCERASESYDYLVVLDADSVMSGRTLVELVRHMEANPRAGLIQTVPLPARQETRFGRLVQFAAALYSPLLAAGQSFWSAETANYWGHNAILRMEPFRRHARLPTLPGRPPLGGEILSHDFVEAALLRRAGWQAYLLPELGGSWEEVPGSVPDFAQRDRRWAQGSIQHLRLLGMPGLHPLSRVHFMLGAMGYVSSFLWLLLLLASTAYIVLPADAQTAVLGGSGPGATSSFAAAPSLLATTAALLFLPKALGVGLALRRPDGFGSRPRLALGALAEAAFAVVFAPIMMLFHSRFVMEILAGRDVAWGAQQRDGRKVRWPEAARRGGWITAAGAVWAGGTLAVSPPFFLWLSPIFLGLLLAIPLIRWSSGSAAAAPARAERRWLAVPAEVRAPAELSGRPAQGRPGHTRSPGRDGRSTSPARRPRPAEAVGAAAAPAPTELGL